MIYVYSIEEKVFVDKKFQDEIDPVSNLKGLGITVSQQYVSLILPMFPIGPKVVTVHSLTTGSIIPATSWTPSIQQKAKQAKSEAKGTWKLFSFLIVFALIIVVGFAYTRLSIMNNDNIEKYQDEYRLAPQVNDLVLVKVWPKDHKTSDDLYGAIFKIIKIEGDSMFMKRTYQHEKLQMIFTPDKKKRVLERFDTSDKAFEPNIEVYKLERFKDNSNGSLTTFTKSEQTDDLLEIMFIKRP